MMPIHFATVHEYSLINWSLQISEAGGIPRFLRNLEPEPRETVFQVTLHPVGQRDSYPPVLKVDFKLKLVGSSDQDILAPVRFTHPPGFPNRNGFNSGYSTPASGAVRDFLVGVIGNRRYENCMFEILTVIVFDIKEFLSMTHLNRIFGKPMPVDLNFRFNLLMNQKTHNFLLTTTTQLEFPCNKEGLYVASPYFRKNLTSTMTSFPLDVQYLEAIEVVISWMFTESYHPPTKLTPKLAEEIVKLSERIVPPGPNRKQLAGSIERHCFEELILNCEDMAYVKELMLMAHTNRLDSLHEACNATIISFHFADFCRDMKQNPDPAFTQHQMHRSSVMSRLYDNYGKSLCVHSFMRKIPPVVMAQQG